MIIISFKLKTKIFLFKLYYYFSRLIAFFFQKKEAVFCFPRGFIFAPSRGQRMSALRDLFPLKFRNLRKILRAFDKADGVVLDIGANVGYSSVVYSDFFSKSTVYAFEPYPKNIYYLTKNTSGLNVNIINKGLSDKPKKMKFGLPSRDAESKNTGRITTNFDVWDGVIDVVAVDVMSGDQFIAERHLSNVIFIKIDVEGMEALVIEGLQSEILKNKPVICVELNGTYVNSDDKILKVLQNLCLNGYSSFIERRGRLEKHNLAKIEISENLDVFLLPVS